MRAFTASAESLDAALGRRGRWEGEGRRKKVGKEEGRNE
jgi:hypothetical protein